ncbi:hypothetical protein PQI07_27245 [Methylobacterium sp. 092160098-2]|uniref:hypothetical protein n=1 Tax=Methylobacterium sp. 092160098-2 TaxID=3025129 RepID=UPI0023819F37|nr:hypothetical protein [Methylobacterium sp. 092160098-2]MDE4914371.1 hypothetical protein [Methylobacterium sp. 092160098-2]
MSTANFTVEISAVDPEVMAAFARTLNPDLELNAAPCRIVEEILINPPRAPLDDGYEIRTRAVRDLGLGRFVLDLEAEIFDEAGFLIAVRSAYAKAWDEQFEPENFGEALYEIVLGSNASPGPLEIGFEILNHEHRGEPVAPSQPAP